LHTTTSVDIDCPAADAFAVVSDFSRNPEWQQGMVACRWTSEGGLALGATYEQEARFLGKAILTTFEVTELDPGRSVSIASVVSTFPIRVTRSVQPLGEGRCRVTADVSGDPPWYLRMVPFMGVMMKRSIQGDYERLKAMLEDETRR
jgi:hypothetical protein